ncbi:deoxyribose-phosphate aldolase [Microbaculum marinisediminis]|uniref:Deoxyribose-phosphate aldolase n=1 Tax=Microbaculum marinisediminis TaxID=2931392 RepID=A0AAW5QZG5_9HYPH|nr:deoxyribose-phosphate aldolase [Microbaculum sp. A6E488]MCT8973395.1 deoxyribose-phosphate aldolase [Microbaculum sp. A6E488]
MNIVDCRAVAMRALACLDLTNLDATCTPADVAALCARATTAHGPVAAICIWPRFVAQARPLLTGTPVRIATVVNFPDGESAIDAILDETDRAMVDGADEIDMVIAYRRIATDPAEAEAQVARVRAATQGATRGATLKVILETGELEDPALIRSASGIAIRAGADFIKTSTGKVTVNATPEAARIMLSVIAETGGKVGFKAAGGIRTLDDAATYLGLADEILGADWARPETFRFGASGLLDALLAELDGRTAARETGTGY